MDFLPIAFLILFVFIGGVIAVVADNVGRTLGKKRLRIGRLRPKHTAMVGTFIVGALISIFTIVLVTIVSSDVRQWILEGRRAAVERDRALKNLSDVHAQLTSQERVYNQLNRDYQAKSTEVTRQAERLASLQGQIGTLEPQIRNLREVLARSNEKITELNRARTVTQQELASKQAQIAQAQSDLKDAKAQRALQEKMAMVAAKAKQSTDDRNQDLTHQNEVLDQHIGDLQSNIDKLQGQIGDLQSARQRAQDQLTGAKEQLTKYSADLSDASARLNELNGQLTAAQSIANISQNLSNQARLQPITYQIGEEVSRLTVDAGISVQDADEALTSLLRSARVAAGARGAKPLNGMAEAGLTPQASPDNQKMIPEETVRRQIVQRIAGSRLPRVLIAYSSINSFRGEPVFLEIRVADNPLVFHRGQVIAETSIDGHRETSFILHQVEDLLSNKVRDRAKAEKMIPRMGTDQFGEIAPEDIYELMTQIKAVDRTVRVQAVAVNDVHAGDPLKLELRLR